MFVVLCDFFDGDFSWEHDVLGEVEGFFCLPVVRVPVLGLRHQKDAVFHVLLPVAKRSVDGDMTGPNGKLFKIKSKNLKIAEARAPDADEVEDVVAP